MKRNLSFAQVSPAWPVDRNHSASLPSTLSEYYKLSKKKKPKDLAHINSSKNPVTMAEAEKGSATTGSKESNVKEEISLKDKGNEFFKAGNYLKAAALYTQAIKLDPSNPTLYR